MEHVLFKIIANGYNLNAFLGNFTCATFEGLHVAYVVSLYNPGKSHEIVENENLEFREMPWEVGNYAGCRGFQSVAS